MSENCENNMKKVAVEPCKGDAQPYRVGKGRPPLAAQFKPGWRGGPGTPLGSKHFTTLVYQLANSKSKSAAVDELKKKYGVKTATHFVEWFDELAKIAMDATVDVSIRRTALTDLLKFFVAMPSQKIDIGGQEDNPVQLEQKMQAVLVELLGTIPKPKIDSEPKEKL